MHRLRLLALSALALASTAVMAAPFAAAQQTGSDMAMVRVVHASPDAPAVDVWVDGQPAIRSLAFGQFTGHTPLPAGSHRVRVTPAGTEASSAVIDATLDLAAGKAYTVMAVGRVAEIKPLVLEDDRMAPSGSRARFVHASPDAPAVDIAVAGGPVVISNAAFGDNSGYIEVPTGDVPPPKRYCAPLPDCR